MRGFGWGGEEEEERREGGRVLMRKERVMKRCFLFVVMKKGKRESYLTKERVGRIQKCDQGGFVV